MGPQDPRSSLEEEGRENIGKELENAIAEEEGEAKENTPGEESETDVASSNVKKATMTVMKEKALQLNRNHTKTEKSSAYKPCYTRTKQ